jgi:hypothetical protein
LAIADERMRIETVLFLKTRNVAFAEEKGLHVYPEAVTLMPGVTRRIQVSIEGQPTAPELLMSSTTDTKYFVSNPNLGNC